MKKAFATNSNILTSASLIPNSQFKLRILDILSSRIQTLKYFRSAKLGCIDPSFWQRLHSLLAVNANPCLNNVE